LWRLPLISSRLPLFLYLNEGDYLHKLVDFSWVYFIFSNLYKYNKSVEISAPIFQNIIFIRVFRNILIFILIIFYL
jgi:hypothetical protein